MSPDRARVLHTFPTRRSSDLGEGGTLKNNRRERFMEKYDPKRMELSTRDVVARATTSRVESSMRLGSYFSMKRSRRLFFSVPPSPRSEERRVGKVCRTRALSGDIENHEADHTEM